MLRCLHDQSEPPRHAIFHILSGDQNVQLAPYRHPNPSVSNPTFLFGQCSTDILRCFFLLDVDNGRFPYSSKAALVLTYFLCLPPMLSTAGNPPVFLALELLPLFLALFVNLILSRTKV